MVDFNCWSMPINYRSQLAEHAQVRNGTGIFDVSHMTIIDFEGPDSISFLKKLLSNDIGKLINDGDGLYSAMLNNSGGIIDDLIAYKMPFGYRLVVNCGTRDSDLKWINKYSKDFDVMVSERQDLAMLAIQGPNSFELLKDLSFPIQALEEKKKLQGIVDGNIFAAKTGYTGENGFEIMLPNENAELFWTEALAGGAKPIGLGARDTLRLEAGMNLYGSEMNENISPLECNMEWTVSLEDEDRSFIGKEAFIEKKLSGKFDHLVGIILEERAILRSGQEIYFDQDKTEKGIVTSGTYSPSLKKPIALARVPVTNKKKCFTEIRGKVLEVKIGKPGFIKEGNYIF